MRDEYMIRRDLVYKGLCDAGFSFPCPEGAFYMFIPVKEPVYEKIHSQGVILVPGKAFGERGNGYARMSYAQNRETLKKAVQRISEVVSR